MEFYGEPDYLGALLASFNSQRDEILQNLLQMLLHLYLCFNSQRDGILPNMELHSPKLILVSIPNGMEFYYGLERVWVSKNGFNSQRDGILRSELLLSLPCQFKFQFPTGWNST